MKSPKPTSRSDLRTRDLALISVRNGRAAGAARPEQSEGIDAQLREAYET